MNRSDLRAELSDIGRHVQRQAEGLMQRAALVVARKLNELGPDRLTALAQVSDAQLLAALAAQALENEPSRAGRLARLRLKGAQRFVAMIDAHGGAYGVHEAAQLLGTRPEALHKAAQRGRVLAYKWGGQLRFPVWQFTPEGQVLPGLAEALKALPPDIGARGAARFFLTPGNGGASPTPLDLLRTGEAVARAEVAALARRYLEHTAA